jgi:oxaloacetate decarboxylase alpha subunit
MPAELVDAMQAAGPATREYRPYSRPVVQLLRELCARKDIGDVLIQKPGFRLALSRDAGRDAGAAA